MIGCADIGFVDRITIVNETGFPASVEVSGAERDGWLGLGRARKEMRRDFTEVIDQGEVWVFRFEYVDGHHEEVEMTRSELAEEGWRVAVPPSFESELRRLGFEPPP